MKEVSFIILFSLFSLISFPQVIVDSKAVVDNVDFNLINEELIITYDLINSKPREQFLVKVKIMTESGDPINAKSFSGDLGEGIFGGLQRKIIWEISKDIAFLEDKIYVEVEAVNQNPKIIKSVSRGTAILLSTAYPGLGSSKITLKKYHLVKGIAGYGTLVGWYIFKKQADQSSVNYQNAATTADRDKYFEAYNDQKLTSKVFLFASGAVWLTDYVTDLVVKNRSQQKGFKSNIVYIGPNIISPDYYAGFTIIYNF
jgi:hypothetical protein